MATARFSLGNVGRGKETIGQEVKFTGQILPIAKKVEYFLDFKQYNEKTYLGIADGRVVCDNKTVFEASESSRFIQD